MFGRRVGVLVVSCLLVPVLGCTKKSAPKDEEGKAAAAEGGETTSPAVASGPVDIAPQPRATYARSLEQQLDLLPADAKEFFIIRDLTPVVDQVGVWMGAAEGPMMASASLLEGEGGEDIEKARAKLTQTKAALMASGISFDAGLIAADTPDGTLTLLKAPGIDGLTDLVTAMGEDYDVPRHCATLSGLEGWIGCHEDGKEKLAAYAPGKQSKAHLDAIAGRLPKGELETANLLFLGQPNQPVVAVATDPGVWQASFTLPDQAKEDVAKFLRPGTAKALRWATPGAGFAWVNVDVANARAQAGSDLPPIANPMLGSLTGEVFLGVVGEKDPLLVAQVGVNNPDPMTGGVQLLAGQADKLPKTFPEAPGMELDISTESVDVGGKKVPAVHAKVKGAQTDQLAKMGMKPEAIVFAAGEYATAAFGAGPELIERQLAEKGSGPAPAVLQSLPPALAGPLQAGEVSAVYHFGFDGLQAPLDYAEMLRSNPDVPAQMREQMVAMVGLVRRGLAPLSSISMWTTHEGDDVTTHFAVTMMGHGGSDEGKEAAGLVQAQIAGEDVAAKFAALAEKYPSSHMHHAYRLRSSADEQAMTAALTTTAIVGIAAAVAIPAFTKYVRRSKTSEAKVHIAILFDAISAYYAEHEKCAKVPGGAAGVTPPLALACGSGPDGKCQPVANPSGPGEYAASEWHKGVWKALSFQIDEPHAFHYDVRSKDTADGCQFTVQAFGDLDDDGLFSTYERSGMIDESGVNAAAGLYIDQELE